MSTHVKSYVHPSKELTLDLFTCPDYVVATYNNLAKLDEDEYLGFLKLTGDFLSEKKTGRLLADFSMMPNFPAALRATAINHFRSLITDKVPFLLLAIVKEKESFKDFALEIALEVAKPLSKKFIDGQIFTNKTEAWSGWLIILYLELRRTNSN